MVGGRDRLSVTVESFNSQEDAILHKKLVGAL